jgi:aromatic-L-amino-acid decarboxylase
VVLDPHKSLFLPYGTGSLVVRDPEALHQAHRVEAEYLPPTPESAEFLSLSDHSPELSRPFRGLRVWLALQLAGAAAFRAQLNEKLDLARWAATELRSMPEVEIVAEPQLSLLAFRVARPGLTPEAADALNRRVLEQVNRRGRVYITGSTTRDRFILRMCVLSFRTHQDRIAMAVEDIREAIEHATA